MSLQTAPGTYKFCQILTNSEIQTNPRTSMFQKSGEARLWVGRMSMLVSLWKLRSSKGFYDYFKGAICLILAPTTSPTPPHAEGGLWEGTVWCNSCCGSQIGWGQTFCKDLPGCIIAHSKTPINIYVTVSGRWLEMGVGLERGGDGDWRMEGLWMSVSCC